MDLPEQLELPYEGAFAVRLTIETGLALFWEEDWRFTAKSTTTKQCFERIKEFCRVNQLRFVDEWSKSTVEALRRWLKTCGRQGLCEATINTHHVIVTAFFNFLYRWQEEGKLKKIQLPAKNPGSQVPKVDERPFAEKIAWPKKVIRRLVKTALELQDISLAETIEVLYAVPLRQGDLWRLTRDNVNLPRMVIYGIQHKTVTRKNPSGVPYLLHLTKHTARIIERRMETVPPGKPLFKKPTQKKWKLVRSTAGCSGVKLKHMRHSAATLLLDQKVDPETVKNMLGHTSLRMLPTYAIRNVTHLKKAAEKLDKDDKSEILK